MQKDSHLTSNEGTSALGMLNLGVPFMDDNQVKMNFGHQGCSIKAFLQTENDYEMVKLQTFGQKTLQVSNIDRIQPGDKVAYFELNRLYRCIFSHPYIPCQKYPLDNYRV